MKFSALYVEKEVANVPRVQEIVRQLPDTPTIYIDRYGEVFNRKSQNFRIQKLNPALILASKHGRRVLETPPGYGFDTSSGYYFSHMLNCIYDCRYCFLQGMYRSAHYVLFVNYEDFIADLQQRLDSSPDGVVFYSGYDCDSLALDPLTGFISFFTNWFDDNPGAMLELRTKSTQIRSLLNRKPVPNCVIAMSFTPQEISDLWEMKVPDVDKRVDALVKLQQAGWKVAIRLEPLIYNANFEIAYENLISKLFSSLDVQNLHSVTTGMYRLPREYYRKIVQLYPDESLFAKNHIASDGMASQEPVLENLLLTKVENLLSQYVPSEKYFRCG